MKVQKFMDDYLLREPSGHPDTVRERLLEFLFEPFKAHAPGNCVKEIAELLKVSPSTLSFEIRRLRIDDLIEVETCGWKKGADKITRKF
jgi:Mn-dependent DtxR family transcriptional regulator